MTKVVYSYDPTTNFYVGWTEADESPLEEGVYHIPAYTAEIAPPDFITGFLPRWTGHNWEVVELPKKPGVHMSALSARQIRLGLLAAGISPSSITDYIEAMPEGAEREAALVEWEYATQYDRNHPLIATLGDLLDLSHEQINDLWLASVNL